jgi:acetoin utilization protein AcuB
MRVSELMSRELIAVEPNESVEQAVTLLRTRGVRHLLVMKRGQLVGIISDRDIKRALDFRKTRKKLMDIGGFYFLLEPILVAEIMTPNPVTILPGTFVEHAATIMVQRRFGALPVMESGRTLGIVTETDLLRYFCGVEKKRGFDGTKDDDARQEPIRTRATGRAPKKRLMRSGHL